MLIKSIKLNEYIFTSETFFVVSLINLIIFSLLTAYNSKLKFPLIQSALINVSCYMLFLYAVLLYNENLSTLKLTSFFNSICYDYLSFISKTIIIFSSIICLIFIKDYIIKQKINKVEYVIILLFSILGLLLLCSANDLLTVYLGMELQSLSFYLLAAFRKKSSYSVDAGLKYFILGSFSSSLFLFGSSFIYVAYGSINFDDIKLLSDFFSTNTNDLPAFYGASSKETYLSEEELNNYLLNSLTNDSQFAALLEKSKEWQSALTIDSTVLIKDIILPDFFKRCDYIITSGKYNPESGKVIDALHALRTNHFEEWAKLEGPYCKESYDRYFIEPVRPMVTCNDGSKFCIIPKCSARYEFINEIQTYLKGLKYIDQEMVDKTIVHNRNLMLESTGALKQENMFEFQYFAISGLLLIFFSLFFKLSLAPFHLWSPDVYENSPTSSSFFFAFNWIQEILLLIAVFSVIAGSLGGLYQRKLKSLLAYSSISHMGYLMIAFSSASIEGIQMLFCYLIVYTITGLCLWSCIILIRLKKKDKIKQNKDLADLVLLIKSNYMLALILMSTLFSIAGIPPLIGFIAKVNIFLVAIESKFYIVSIISVLFSVVSTFFYLRLIKIMCFEPLLVGRLYYPINSSKVFIIVLLFLSLFLFFIDPTLLYLLGYKISYLFL